MPQCEMRMMQTEAYRGMRGNGTSGLGKYLAGNNETKDMSLKGDAGK